MKSGIMWKFWCVSINFFWLKISHYDRICLLSSVFIKILLGIWEILAWNMIRNLLCKKRPYVVKSNVSRIFMLVKMCSMNFFMLIPSNWAEKNKIHIFCQKQHFVDILKTIISLAAIWVFSLWLRCHLTPMLLAVAKQSWCQFEALECICHFG